MNSHSTSVATGRGTLIPYITRFHCKQADQHIGVSFRNKRLRDGGAWGVGERGRASSTALRDNIEGLYFHSQTVKSDIPGVLLL